MSAQFHETERGKNFFDEDIPNLIHVIKQLTHELQQNTEMQYKFYESMQRSNIANADDMTIEQLIGILRTFPQHGRVRVLGCNKVCINKCGSDISFDDQPFEET